MNPLAINVKRLHPNATMPDYATPGAACFDLYACFDDVSSQASFSHTGIFKIGLAFEIPPGYVMQIFSRSGHGFKSDIRLANCVGIIDSDYRGEICVKLTKEMHSSTLIALVNHGDRIAQAMIIPVPAVTLQEVEEISTTERSDGGFGSTRG
jgi:dUTP pyrophosphatase